MEGINEKSLGRKGVSALRRVFKQERPDICLLYTSSDNGAAMLAKMLLEECTCLNLFIGRSINPAHQNPNLPMDLSIKLRIIGELSELISNLGKQVECTYY